MYKITKQFHFSASHRLHGLPDDHPCGRLHGHNYIIEVELQSDQLDSRGFVVDYGDLKPLADYINFNLDHQHLNNILDFQPSAENLAKHLFDFCKSNWSETMAVRVSETPKTWAEYTE